MQRHFTEQPQQLIAWY